MSNEATNWKGTRYGANVRHNPLSTVVTVYGVGYNIDLSHSGKNSVKIPASGS